MNRIIAGPLMGLLAIFCLIFSSCQKELDIDLENPPPIPEPVKDSTLLIKSIAWIYNDGADSIVEHYTYDTVNKKIILIWTDSDTDPFDPTYQSVYNNSKAILSYNNKGLLVHVAYEYAPSYNAWEYDWKTTEITYDSDDIVQKMVVEYMGGSTSSREFNKTALAGGHYRLNWEEYNPAIPNDRTQKRTAEFRADHKNILNSTEGFRSVSNVDYKYAWRDTLIYDETGNVVSVLTNIKDEQGNTEENFVAEEYSGRWSKGDQLSNQRKLILNGIANLPFGDNDEMISYALGVLSFQMSYESLQYSQFPIKGGKVRLLDGSYQDLVTVTEFDDRERLKKCTTFYIDTEVIYSQYKITYFK